MTDPERKKLYALRARRLEQARIEARLSNVALADRLDQLPNYVTRLRNGTKHILGDTARDIEEILALPRDWLDEKHLPEADPLTPKERELLAAFRRLVASKPSDVGTLLMEQLHHTVTSIYAHCGRRKRK